MRRIRRSHLGLIVAIVMGAFNACGPPPADEPAPASAPAKPAESNVLELIFPYGSEKEKWLEEVTGQFNQSGRKTADGRIIHIRPMAMGSGETTGEILSGRLQAHLASPASSAFIKLANADSRARTGVDLIGETESLVLSPVVIAMWKPMAEAIGWGTQPIGWSDILALAKDPAGWSAHGYPEWGSFKFGHTHPEYSNSGLISAIAEVYAGVGKTAGLSLADVELPQTGEYLAGIERAVVHYGTSTGFFGRKMFANGPEYLSAAVLYENMIIESYDPANRLPFPIVAIYPREGTFWSDHPVGIVQRDWVTPGHQDAARIYIDFLLEPAQQQRAMTFGFRPADVNIALAAPIDVQHGVDPAEPKTTLEVPAPDVMQAIIGAWRKNKKHANVVLVFDTSGSMNESHRIENAREGALELVEMLGDEDTLSLLPFNSDPVWSLQNAGMATQRGAMKQRIGALFPQGGTALYDAIAMAHQYLLDHPSPDRISAIVALSDGEDTESKMKLAQLLAKTKFDGEKQNIRIFTIAYGTETMADVLKQIADNTQAQQYKGTTEDIREVFKGIATFF